MAFKMSEGSLFAILLRSAWWYGVAIGFALIAISFVLFGGQYVVLGVFSAVPFFVIAGLAAYKQSKQPSQKRVQEVYDQARKMKSAQIASKIAASYTDARYDSEPFKGNAADFLLTRGNRVLLLCSKRFKVGNTGVDPLKELVAAGETVEATGYLYVALGDVSAAAVGYANQNDIEIIHITRLAAYFDGQVDID